MNILAQEYVIVAESPDRDLVYAGSPSLAQLPTGELIASYEWFRPVPKKESIPNQTEIKASADGGHTWKLRGKTDIIWPSLFVYDDALYMIGNRRRSREVIISRSLDGGYNWHKEVTLFNVRSHGAPTSVTCQNGYIYRAFETCPKTGRSGGGRSSWESFVVAGDIKKDLLSSSAWRMSNTVRYPGTPENMNVRSYPPEIGTEDCWLEGNIISVQGQLRNILRVHMKGRATVGMAAICDLDDDGGGMNYRFSQFCPMLGAQCKFHIIFDEVSQLFWTTVTPPVDTFSPVEDKLRELGFRGPPGNERRILLLIYSLDAMNWFQAGCVAMSRKVLDSFSYASQLIVGEDLLVLARSSVNGLNQHDTNFITLHRVKNFRDLALNLTRDYELT